MDLPDPSQAASLDDLAWCLRHLRMLADTPTLRELERRTIHAEGTLPGTDLRRIPLKRATIADVLAGQAFPRKAFLLTFAEACGVDLRADKRWGEAWNRLAVRYRSQSAPAAPPREDRAADIPPADHGVVARDRARAEPDRSRHAPEPAAPAGSDPPRAGADGSDAAGTPPWALADFLEAADAASGSVSPLLWRLARREIERVTSFMRQLPPGQAITYDGEDREWLLGLTREAQTSIEAISLAGPDGFDDGLWTSDLGVRYLELQRQAIRRGALVQRIFIFENELLTRDESFLRIAQMQRDTGIDVRVLNFRRIPGWLHGMISDFIIFDREVSYEMMHGAPLSYTRFPVFRTILEPTPWRVAELREHFKQLWTAAEPERGAGN
jgi:hypothetical protein